MPNFKPKTKKKFVSAKKQQTCTLDSKHHEKMEEFKYIDEQRNTYSKEKTKES